jgi:hypothetical protein
MKKDFGVTGDLVYTLDISSQHMDVLRLQSGVRWARGYVPWIGSKNWFSQETGVECQLDAKEWLETHFAFEAQDAQQRMVHRPFFFSDVNFNE